MPTFLASRSDGLSITVPLLVRPGRLLHAPYPRTYLSSVKDSVVLTQRSRSMRETVSVELPEVMRARRAELGLSQADLAKALGIDQRQVRRWEAGDASPSLPVAKGIAAALGLSLDELAGQEPQHVTLAGDWWAAWQTWHDGLELVNVHQMRMVQRGDVLDVTATTRGTQAVDEGGYMWRGEWRIWDNEILMGWYVGTEGAVRSKGTVYFRMHQHGQTAVGRWVGLSHDGPIITGHGAMARTEAAVAQLMADLLA